VRSKKVQECDLLALGLRRISGESVACSLQGQGCNFANFVRMGLDSQDDLAELIEALKLKIIFKVIFRICSRNILRSLWRTLTCRLPERHVDSDGRLVQSS
jgi:hypothetical protein